MDYSWLRTVVSLLLYLAISGGFLATLFGDEFDPAGDNRGQRQHSEFMQGRRECRCRVVFVVIDALRSEFLDRHESLPFLTSLQRNGSGLVFAAQAKAPTVTLPRTKCLLTGSVPRYLDLLDNYGTSQLADRSDSWPALAAAAGHKIVFYGDKTWLQLLPDTFVRSQGVDPFNVYDYTKEDEVITRHVRAELSLLASWDAMAVHYIGVDHIGHVYGPNHPLMAVKLRQMDTILHAVYDAISSNENTCSVMVLCGDHGMTSSGSHGGSSYHETHAALAFYSPQFRKQSNSVRVPIVQQIDIAPTISALLGLPPPRASIGRLVWPVVRSLLGLRTALAALVDNARQMAYLCQQRHCSSLADEVLPFLNDLALRISDASQAVSGTDGQRSAVNAAIDRLQQALGVDDGSRGCDTAVFVLLILLLAGTIGLLVSRMQLPSLVTSIGRFSQLVLLLTVLTLMLWLARCQTSAESAAGAVTSMLSCSSWSLVITVLGVVTLMTVFSMLPLPTVSIQPGSWRVLTTILALVCCLQPLSLFASSLVEEEHQLWYQLLSTSWLVLLWITYARHVIVQTSQSANRSESLLPTTATWCLLPLLLCSAVLRRYNVNGDKWRHLLSLRDYIFDNDYERSWQWVGAVVALWLVTRRDSGGIIAAVTALLCFLQWHRGVLLLLLLLCLFGGPRGLHSAWVWLGVVLCRPANVPAWLGVTLLTSVLSRWLCAEENGGSGQFSVGDRSLRIAALFYSVGRAAFFYMGNSNSPATIDIASGYTVWPEHVTAAAVSFTVAHTMLAPVLATLLALSTARRCRCWSETFHWLTAIYGVALLGNMLVLVWFRQHLFVWSVFTPRLLYEVFHCAAFIAACLADCLAFGVGNLAWECLRRVVMAVEGSHVARAFQRNRQVAVNWLLL